MWEKVSIWRPRRPGPTARQPEVASRKHSLGWLAALRPSELLASAFWREMPCLKFLFLSFFKLEAFTYFILKMAVSQEQKPWGDRGCQQAAPAHQCPPSPRAPSFSQPHLGCGLPHMFPHPDTSLNPKAQEGAQPSEGKQGEEGGLWSLSSKRKRTAPRQVICEPLCPELEPHRTLWLCGQYGVHLGMPRKPPSTSRCQKQRGAHAACTPAVFHSTPEVPSPGPPWIAGRLSLSSPKPLWTDGREHQGWPGREPSPRLPARGPELTQGREKVRFPRVLLAG